MEDLDGHRRQPDLDVGVDQGMRHGVAVAVDLDVVVDVHPGLPPFGVDVPVGRERLEGRTVKALEEHPAGLPAVPLHGPGVEILEQLADAGVEGGQREERLMPKPREDPPLRDQHGRLDFRLVTGLRRTRRQDHGAVVARPVGVAALDAGLIPAGIAHAGAKLVGDDEGRGAAEVLQDARVAAEEVGQALRPRRLGVGVVRGAEHPHKELDIDPLAGPRIDQVRVLPSVVDKQLLASLVDLPHRATLQRHPATIVGAEGRVAETVGVLSEILQVEQFQRDPLPPQLGVDMDGVRQRPRRGEGQLGPPEPFLQLIVGQGGDGLPREALVGGPADDRGDGAGAHADAPGGLAVTPPQGPFQPKNLSNLSHGQSLRGHRVLRGTKVHRSLDGRTTPVVASRT